MKETVVSGSRFGALWFARVIGFTWFITIFLGISFSVQIFAPGGTFESLGKEIGARVVLFIPTAIIALPILVFLGVPVGVIAESVVLNGGKWGGLIIRDDTWHVRIHRMWSKAVLPGNLCSYCWLTVFKFYGGLAGATIMIIFVAIRSLFLSFYLAFMTGRGYKISSKKDVFSCLFFDENSNVSSFSSCVTYNKEESKGPIKTRKRFDFQKFNETRVIRFLAGVGVVMGAFFIGCWHILVFLKNKACPTIRHVESE